MYKLYWSDNSGAFVVHAALSEAGADFSIIDVDFENQEYLEAEFRKINPLGQVPVLQLQDGTVITESVAIVLHLAESFPNAGLLADPGTVDRANAYRWMMYMATNTYIADCRYYYSHRYTVNVEQSRGVKDAGLKDMDDSFDLMDRTLGRQAYLAGNSISIADTYLVMMVMWHPDVPSLLDRCVNVLRIVKEVQAQPVIQLIWDQNFPDQQILH
jgi:glutathione S-transferase